MIPYLTTDEEIVAKRIKSVSEADVVEALRSSHPGLKDLIALISPTAANFLPQLAKFAERAKKMHFGHTVKLYTPLYLSNYCINRCVYCGFNADTTEPRRRLTVDEAVEEAKVIKSFGMDSILLVSGEDPLKISIDYLVELVVRLKKIFSYVSIEIYPLDLDGYSKLFKAGVDGLTLYQETYDRERYDEMHLSGPKANYDARIESIINGGKAGFRTLGIGYLLGLYDYRIEAVSLAAHAFWLRKHFWKSKIQFSFPRITPACDSFHVPSPVSEIELEQLVLAFRIVFPDSEISISTRENCEFRNRIAKVASTMSAASSVIPGGYADSEEQEEDLGQFSLNDTRDAAQMEKDMKKLGLEVVYKDWDKVFV